MSTPIAATISGTSHWVSSDGFRLHLWEKRLDAPHGRERDTGQVILLIHGATYSGPTDYDVQAPGKDYSLMDYLAARGHDVFTFDIRGYGRSDKPADGFSVSTEAAVRDTSEVVNAICNMRGVGTVDLFGWSWGSAIASLYASLHPERVRRLVRYAGSAGPAPTVDSNHAAETADPGEPGVLTTRESIVARIEQDVVIPEAQEAFVAAALRWDAKSPGGTRSELATGGPRPRAAPEAITVPTLMIYGARDAGYRPAQVADFFARLNTPDKTLMVVPDAGHFLILQKPRMRLFEATAQFFGQD